MKMDIPNIKNKRIIIIEGIAGSGKSTFQKQFAQDYNKKGFLVYTFLEGELLFSWKHFWIKNIEKYRINYMHSLLDYCIELIKENPKTIITLNRFHITYAIISKFDKQAKKQYELLIERLKKLPVHIFIGKLSESEIEKKKPHSERKGIWKIHQQKRLENSKFDSLEELYTTEQKLVFTIAQKQGIPYTIFEL